MKLLIDLGNTRLKACAQDDLLRLLEEVIDVPSMQSWLGRHGALITAVAIASVATQEAFRRVKCVVTNSLPSVPIFQLQYDSKLLATHYEFPERLGIDRWLALLPLVRLGDAVVIDAGTAFTIDVLGEGAHQGGYILPGLRLQRDVLAQQTASVSFPSIGLGAVHLGLNTAECVSHGGLRALIALANDVGAQFSKGSGRSRLYITGGDAPYFKGHLDAECRPLLVFEGMLIALNHLVEKSR